MVDTFDSLYEPDSFSKWLRWRIAALLARSLRRAERIVTVAGVIHTARNVAAIFDLPRS